MKLNATPKATHSGWLNGTIGIVIFAGSLPATRLAVQEIDPIFLTAARIAIAAILASVILIVKGSALPQGKQWHSLFLVVIGVIISFPLFSALALLTVPSTHALVFVALLPLSTAIVAVVRFREKPRKPFWIFALLGSAIISAYSLSHGRGGLEPGDGFMIAAILLGSLGYAEGGKLARQIGGVLVICWALVLGAPLFLPLIWIYWPADLTSISISGWASLAYVALFSQLVGFFFWYRGLAIGGIAKISQLQLVQPLIGILLGALILSEPVEMMLLAAAVAVIGCVWAGRRYA